MIKRSQNDGLGNELSEKSFKRHGVTDDISFPCRPIKRITTVVIQPCGQTVPWILSIA